MGGEVTRAEAVAVLLSFIPEPETAGWIFSEDEVAGMAEEATAALLTIGATADEIRAARG